MTSRFNDYQKEIKKLSKLSKIALRVRSYAYCILDMVLNMSKTMKNLRKFPQIGI